MEPPLLTLTRRIWISFIVVVVTALWLAWFISENGHQAQKTTQNLVTVQLPKLALIKRVRSALAEHERLLYEYYSTTNRDLIWPKIQTQHHDLTDYLDSVNQSFEGNIMELPALYGEISYIRQSLDNNLGSPPVDWDMARFDLANLTLTREKAESILVSLTNKTQNEAWQGAESTQQQIGSIISLVIVFSGLIVLIALFIGYYTQINIRRTAKRKALAKFPERNPNPVLNLKWDGTILFSNPASKRLLETLEVPSNNIQEILPASFFQDLKRWQREHQTQVKFEASISGRHLHYNLSLLHDLESCHLYIEDATERKKAKDQLEYQALHDVHTGLPNRRQFEQNLGEFIKLGTHCSVLFISIDRFKFITSSQGYNIGDLIINVMGQRLLEHCDPNLRRSRTYRLEGSTFCILLETPYMDSAMDLAITIQNAMDEPLEVKEHRYYLNLSMGICHYPQDGQEAQALITNGNAALNHARIKGDSCEQYSPNLHAEEQSWLPIDAGMRQALEKEQFELHYQAKVDAQSTHIKGAEALIRWKDDEGKMISPGLFIPVAEQTGLIIKIGQWVIEEACRQSVKFSEQQQDIHLAINISARQFQHRHFLEQLRHAIHVNKADPSKIELEITESLIMENADQSIRIMKRLKDMGFALAIDDFGTGYSSLSYLKKFPIDTLKVDQTFVRNLESDENDQSIVRAIVDLAKHLNLKTVAEGVETEGQWHFLKSLECDYIQGYLFSKPDTPDKLMLPSELK